MLFNTHAKQSNYVIHSLYNNKRCLTYEQVYELVKDKYPNINLHLILNELEQLGIVKMNLLTSNRRCYLIIAKDLGDLPKIRFSKDKSWWNWFTTHPSWTFWSVLVMTLIALVPFICNGKKNSAPMPLNQNQKQSTKQQKVASDTSKKSDKPTYLKKKKD